MSIIGALKRLLGGGAPPPREAAPAASAPQTDKPMPTEDEVRDALMTVMDPEAGMNIVDLGLVYGVEFKADGVYVEITMTSPACPATGQVVDEARAAIQRIMPRDARVAVDVVWDPPGRRTGCRRWRA
ncbi:MAG: metal-sulfur cluster assembly factor [Burkholderiales bacterium]|nr:metal-sulfur cluster assembly factor [Burkholderiales bacterium]